MQTINQLITSIKRIHEKGFDILNDKRISQTLKLEGLLYFNYIYKLTEDVEQLHLLLQGMHKLGKSDLNRFHYELDIINQNYASISGKQQFLRAMSDYRLLERNLCLFDLDNINEINNQVDFFEARKNLYTKSFEEVDVTKKAKLPTIKADVPYVQFDDKKINLSKYKFPIDSLKEHRVRKGGAITISIQDLTAAAKEMDQIIELNPHISKQSYTKRMEKFQVLVNDRYNVDVNYEIKLQEVCHIIGMVGTGKSTLIQVLSYYLAKNGYRTMVLFESVKDVLEHANLFEQLGVLSTAINGEKRQDNRIQKVIDQYEMIVPEKYANYLIGSCFISELSEGEYDELDMYGHEPCYRMKYRNEHVLCPFYSICPRKENTRKMKDASLIFANIHSFLFNRTGLISNRGRLLLLEYAIDYMDVVIFDEADELQTKLDQVMNESAYTEEILKNNLTDLNRYLDETIQNGNYTVLRDLDVHFRVVLTGLNEMKSLLKNRSIKDVFPRIRLGQWFSAYILAQDLDFLPSAFVEAYKQVIQGKDSTYLGIKNAFLLDTELYENAFGKLYVEFSIQPEHQQIVKCLMAMIIAEKHMLSLQNELENVQKIMDSTKANYLPGIFRRANEDLTRLLPKSPTNNRFGFLYDEEGNTLQIFKQQGIGRSAMIDLPYLKINRSGQPLGPHTILLSGSSFSPGSSAHHINRPVNYILQAPKDIQKFIEQVNIQYVNSEIKVSGVVNKKAALEEMVHVNSKRLQDAFNSEGRTLLIVNSYSQAEWVLNELKKIFPTGVCRLIPDSKVATNDTIQRSKLNQAKEMDFKFLIAPAISIARGFNMVDNKGHSLFDKMFILVRPMSKPKEIDAVVSIVNGEIIKMRSLQDSKQFLQQELIQLKQCKHHAHKVWNMALQDFYSVQQATPLVKKNIIVSRLVLLMQLIGRLLRVTNLDATPPKIILLDHSFAGRHNNSFDLLKEIETYLESAMQSSETGKLVEKLYGPFLEGLKRGKSLV